MTRDQAGDTGVGATLWAGGCYVFLAFVFLGPLKKRGPMLKATSTGLVCTRRALILSAIFTA